MVLRRCENLHDLVAVAAEGLYDFARLDIQDFDDSRLSADGKKRVSGFQVFSPRGGA